MPNSAATRQRVEELVAYLNQLRDQKLDFPTIWRDHLKGHALVIGIPIQVTLGEEPALEIKLINGRRLQFRNGRFQLT